MSVQSSTTHLDSEVADVAVLDKVESQLATGELTPTYNSSRPQSEDERLEDGKLDPEKGDIEAPHGRPAITHRPTGFRVCISRISILIFSVGFIDDLIFDRSFLVCIGQHYRC
jgi:hypothetical protein